MTVLDDTKKSMEAAIDHLKGELKGIRTGRANPALVEGVQLEVYGAQMRLLDVASISIPEPRQILISPFDANNVHAIVKGIDEANLNLRAAVDGSVVRVMVPEMDQKVRSDMVKLAKRKCEETKVAIRNVRRDGNDTVRKQKSSGDIPEDQMKSMEKKIQESTDKYCKMAEDLTQEKEKEITTV
ncbi:MAG: Ribosome-recycling factor [Chlamydiales bacterium]|nr:Ribosome-recycling factor [Chlamydiales bacterium]MCH9636238.1 Ribosome-recycling factor [Chlamydiales bacterium]MCH9703716.1 ribosome recycling factor [Chlamydiota bacterium]